MKKNILLVIVTAIVFTSVGAFAAISYQANEIGYGTGTVKDAIDDLYGKVKEEYTGTTTVTPTTSSQVLLTNNKILNSDITIASIPSKYSNCISDSFTCTTCNTSNGQTVAEINFNPTILVLTGNGGTTFGNYTIMYNLNVNQSTYIMYTDIGANISPTNSSATGTISDHFVYNSGLVFKNFGTQIVNTTINYIACR